MFFLYCAPCFLVYNRNVKATRKFRCGVRQRRKKLVVEEHDGQGNGREMEKFSVKKPFTVLVAVIMVLMLGFVSLTKMQTNLLPDVSTPYLMVVTVYPGR